MYTPRHNRIEKQSQLHQLICDYNFAALVTWRDSAQVTYLPFLLDSNRGPHGTLVSHMARANPHWQTFADGAEAMVMFNGPHAYITPAWYQNQQTVPTWNYMVVHAFGRPRLIEDETTLREMLDRLVRESEATRQSPWNRNEETEVTGKLLPGIVGFEIPIDRLDGKFKLSQNRSAEDRAGVIAGLAGSDHSSDHELARQMRELDD